MAPQTAEAAQPEEQNNKASEKVTLEQKVDDLVTYHRPTDEQVKKIGYIREATKRLILAILDAAPPGPDRSAAIRKARESMMTANAAVVVPPQSF